MNRVLDGGPQVLRDVAMATIFVFLYMVYIGAAWRIRLNRPCAAAMRRCGLMSNYFDRVLVLWRVTHFLELRPPRTYGP